MNDKFPSIWIEVKKPGNNCTLLGGFYHTWTHNLENSEESQVKRAEEFMKQIESALSNSANIIITGDSNLNANKGLEPKFLHRRVASLFQNKMA